MRCAWLVALLLCSCAHTSRPAANASACDSKTVEFTYWHGSVGETYTLHCAKGPPAITVLTTPRYGVDPQSDSKPITTATWRRLWRAFESARWRSLPADCGRGVGRPMLDLTIKDGSASVNYRCNIDEDAETPATHTSWQTVWQAAEAIAAQMYPSRREGDSFRAR